MLGLIKKDLLLIKSNIKSLVIILIIYLMMIFQGSLDVTAVVPIIGIMLFISTFSYDDFNNWNSYAVTFPNGRKNVVKAKYIASLIITIVLGALSLALSIGIKYINNTSIDFKETLPSLVGTMLSCVIIISLLYPTIFKFGSTNGRMILFAIVFGLTGIGALITQFVDMTYVLSIINKIDDYFVIVILAFSSILLGGSYLISSKIYQNKEF